MKNNELADFPVLSLFLIVFSSSPTPFHTNFSLVSPPFLPSFITFLLPNFPSFLLFCFFLSLPCLSFFASLPHVPYSFFLLHKVPSSLLLLLFTVLTAPPNYLPAYLPLYLPASLPFCLSTTTTTVGARAAPTLPAGGI